MLCVALAMWILACSVDHGGRPGDVEEEEDKTISGTVSAGAPVRGVVLLKNASSSTVSISDEIDENGHFSIKLLSDMTGPYILQARGTVGGRAICLHAMGTRADVAATVNITPFTDLIVANVIQKTPEEYFEYFDIPMLSRVATEDNISKHEELVKARFADLFQLFGVNPSDINLMNTVFAADHTGIDGVLDFLRFFPSWNESGVRLPQMTVKLLLSGDEISEDYTVTTDTAVLPAPASLLPAQEALKDIDTVFQNWVLLFAEETDSLSPRTKGIPASDDAALLALFNDGFKHNGYERSGFLGKICLDETLLNMGISGLSLESLDLATGKATVSFAVTNNEGVSEPQYNWEIVKSGDFWRINGNRQIVDVFVGPYAAYSRTAAAVLANGLCVYAWTTSPLGTAEIHHVTVSGPGITAPLVLSRIDDAISDLVLFVQTGSSPRGLYQLSNPVGVTDNSEYVFTLYDSASQPIAVEAVHKRILKRGNVSSADLKADARAIFCEMIKPYQTSFNTFAGQASLECSWTVPPHSIVKELDIYYIHLSGMTNKRIPLVQGISEHTETTIHEQIISRCDVHVRTTDMYDRVFDTFVSKADKDEEKAVDAQAKDIINLRQGTVFPYKLF